MKPSWPTPGVEQPLATVLVAVKDDVDIIRRCVQSLLEASYRPLEWIVVDDGSTDGTREILVEMERENPQLKVIYLDESVGKKRALTEGVRHADGRFLLFTDSDCVMAHDAIERVMLAFAADPDIGAISGHGRALNAEQTIVTRMQDTWYEGQFSVWKAAESSLGTVTCISGPARRVPARGDLQLLRRLGQRHVPGPRVPLRHRPPADPPTCSAAATSARSSTRRYADSEFVTKENHPVHNWKIEYVKSARVWTVVPPTLPKLMRQQIRWKKSFLRNLCFTGRFYYRKGIGPAALFYSHSLFVLATPFMAFRHLIWLRRTATGASSPSTSAACSSRARCGRSPTRSSTRTATAGSTAR